MINCPAVDRLASQVRVPLRRFNVYQCRSSFTVAFYEDVEAVVVDIGIRVTEILLLERYRVAA